MVKHTQKIRGLLLKNCLSLFDHFVGLALKGLIAKLTPVIFVKEDNKLQICFYTIVFTSFNQPSLDMKALKTSTLLLIQLPKKFQTVCSVASVSRMNSDKIAYY